MLNSEKYQAFWDGLGRVQVLHNSARTGLDHDPIGPWCRWCYTVTYYVVVTNYVPALYAGGLDFLIAMVVLILLHGLVSFQSWFFVMKVSELLWKFRLLILVVFWFLHKFGDGFSDCVLGLACYIYLLCGCFHPSAFSYTYLHPIGVHVRFLGPKSSVVVVRKANG